MLQVKNTMYNIKVFIEKADFSS